MLKKNVPQNLHKLNLPAANDGVSTMKNGEKHSRHAAENLPAVIDFQ
jgi:hypothetical protein